MLVRRSRRVLRPSQQIVCYFSDNKNDGKDNAARTPRIRDQQTRGALNDFMKSMSEKADAKGSSPLSKVLEKTFERREEKPKVSGDFDSDFSMLEREPRERRRRGRFGDDNDDDDDNPLGSDDADMDIDGRSRRELDEMDDGADTQSIRNNIIKKGFEFDTEELTSFETYTAHILEESLKTRDGAMIHVIEKPTYRRTRIPRARSTHTLMRTQVPKITSMKAGGMGHRLGEEVWLALNKNVYFSDYQRASMSNYAASYVEKLVTPPPKLLGPKVADKFHITDLMNMKALDPEFRKGYRYFTLEEEALQKAKGKRKVETYNEKAEVVFEEGGTTYLDEDELMLGSSKSAAIEEDEIQIFERAEDVKPNKNKNEKKKK